MHNLREYLIAAAAVALCCAPAMAADLVYLPNGAMSEPTDPSGVLQVLSGQRFRGFVVDRDQAGGPELHLEGIDNIVVLDGDATLVYGGEMSDAHMVTEGEFQGNGLTGDTKSIEIHKNDIIQIPAGTPQWIKPAPGGHIRYIDFRVPGLKE
jgi:mannose-6-phosphate isomerase-like protein (cupin superfamily)